MTFLAAPRRVFVMLVGCCLWGGCLPDGDSPVDERKEPHFVAGRNHTASMDYRAAIESFEKALEVNPRSAAAHFELGWLLEEKERDFAGAIFHYEHFLKLSPNHEKTEHLRQRIITCKQELARTVSLGPVNAQVQRELERLSAENQRLLKQVEALTAQLAQAALKPAPAPRTNTVAVAPVAPTPTNSPTVVPKAQANANASNGSGSGSSGTAVAAPKSHAVKSGETPAAIARKYGITLNALMTANPGLDPKRLRVGQVLTVPAK